MHTDKAFYSTDSNDQILSPLPEGHRATKQEIAKYEVDISWTVLMFNQ